MSKDDWWTKNKDRPLDIETRKGLVELPMLVGALLRSTEIMTVGQRPDRYETNARAERKLRLPRALRDLSDH